MKKFLINVAGFGALVILSCLAVELMLLAKPNEYSYKRDYVEQKGDGIRTLIMGHSHAALGINPEFLGDSVFNLAISGANHYYDAVLAERYIPRLKNLKCVIWPLGYNSQYANYHYPCFTGEPDRQQSTYLCMFEKYMQITYRHFVPYWYWSEIIHSHLGYGVRLFWNSYMQKVRRDPTGFNRYTLDMRPDNWKMVMLPLTVEYESENAPLAAAEGLEDFKRIARACRDSHVRLLVITFPCYKTAQERITERGIKEMQACVDTMRSVYPELEYRNYLADPRFTDNDFKDASHLRDVGAEKFTKIIRNWVDGLERE